MEDKTSNKPWLHGHHDRRESPRLTCRGLLTADLQRAGDHRTVRDVSLSGFAVETPTQFEADTLHHCALHPDDGRPVALLVQVARSDRSHDDGHFVTGFKFSLFEEDGRERLNELMARFVRRAGLGQAAG
ncbi:MAG TPA: PilZ domain-containing protein [Vicinamibacterales bacterium]|nr:PilZ domain-containing protein [Vicinamibacterales bacterium]